MAAGVFGGTGRATLSVAWKRVRTSVSSVVDVTSTPWVRRIPCRRALEQASAQALARRKTLALVHDLAVVRLSNRGTSPACTLQHGSETFDALLDPRRAGIREV